MPVCNVFPIRTPQTFPGAPCATPTRSRRAPRCCEPGLDPGGTLFPFEGKRFHLCFINNCFLGLTFLTGYSYSVSLCLAESNHKIPAFGRSHTSTEIKISAWSHLAFDPFPIARACKDLQSPGFPMVKQSKSEWH